MAPKTFVITGSNRGIGHSLFKKLYSEHKDAKFIITVRTEASAVKAGLTNLDRVSVVYIDFEKFDTIRAGAKKIAELAPEGIDELWNNAGIFGGPKNAFSDEMDPDVVAKEMVVNTVSPIFFTTQLLPLLDKKDTKRVIFVGSLIGCYNIWSKPQSIIEPSTFANGYATSKAAVAFAIMGFAALQKPNGYTIVGIHPGYVDTDMVRTNSAGGRKFDIPKITPDDSAAQMIENAGKITKDTEYHFISYDGAILDEGTPF